MASVDEKFEKLGKKIALFRKKAGMTQVQLAVKIGITREHLGHVEVGIKRPSLELLFLISSALNIKPKDLLDFE